MNAETPHYPNAPIVEAIFDVTAIPCGEWNIEDFKAMSLNVVGDAYADIKQLNFNNIEFSQGGAEIPNINAQFGWLGFELRHKNEPLIVRIRRDGMSLHRLHPYTSFDDIIPEFKKIWAAFSELTKPRSIQRVGLRYVNRIELPDGVSISNLSDYLKVVPHVALPDEADIQSLLSRVHIKQPQTENQAQIAFSTLQSTTADRIAVLLDIDTWDSREQCATNDAIWKSLDSLRSYKNRLFSGSLREKCLTLFK